MTAIGTFVPFEVHVSEEFPGVVVRHLFLITDSQFKTVLIEKPGTYLNTTVLVGGDAVPAIVRIATANNNNFFIGSIIA